MLGGQKPWVKTLAENPLLFLSVLAIVATRIAEKIIEKNYNVWNLVALSISFIGFIFLVLSKKEQLKRNEFLKLGSSNMNEKDKKLYRISYTLMLIGLLLTFLI